jgi:ferredoxin-NADP reductase
VAKTETAQLISRSACEDLLVVRFTKPEGHSFRAGQWLRLKLQTAEGPQTRTLSYASSPEDPYVEIATRISRSAFKQTLATLPDGAVVELSGPGGRFGLPVGERQIVCLTGGIGITPVRSILRDSVQRGAGFDDFLLIYGSRRPRCVAYLDELKAMEASGVRVVTVYESSDDASDTELGFITAEMVRRHLSSNEKRPFVVTGPPVMVQAMSRVLDELGIAQEMRVVESFGSAKQDDDAAGLRANRQKIHAP